jgi:hypothetical protein
MVVEWVYLEKEHDPVNSIMTTRSNSSVMSIVDGKKKTSNTATLNSLSNFFAGGDGHTGT